MKFAAKKGQVFDVHCYARRLGSPLDPVMHIGLFENNAVTQYLAGADDAVGPDSYFRFTAPQDGEYVVWVHDHLQKGGPNYFYRVELTVPAASTSTDIPRVDGNNVSNQDRQASPCRRGTGSRSWRSPTGRTGAGRRRSGSTSCRPGRRRRRPGGPGAEHRPGRVRGEAGRRRRRRAGRPPGEAGRPEGRRGQPDRVCRCTSTSG